MRRIVVSCRLDPQEGFLARARALWVRAEALGATLTAWGTDFLAFAWDEDSLEEAVGLAASAREGVSSAGDAWGCGVAEGEMEAAVLGAGSLVTTGQHAELAWGEPLLVATALARAAAPGETLVHTELGALSRGELATTGPTVLAAGGVTGLRLDDSPPATVPDEPGPTSSRRDSWVDGLLAKRVRVMTHGAREDMLTALRRARARVESGPPALRCQASLALAIALAVANRPEDSLLEALDALARARENNDPRALEACLAFLAKLYATAGRSEQATDLRALAHSISA